MNNNNHISQQIAEQERLYKSRNRLSWIFGWSTIVAMIAVPLLCGLANISADTSYTATLFSFFSFFILGSVFQSIAKRHKKKIQRLQEQQRQLNVQNNIAPIIESSCKHCSGLPIGENSLCRLTIFRDKVYIYSGTLAFQIPMERIRSVDVLTQEQTETVFDDQFSRNLLSTLLFGELGMVISVLRPDKEKKITTTEENLVITYEKDGEAKFIALKDLPCDKIIQEIKKYVTLAPKSIEL